MRYEVRVLERALRSLEGLSVGIRRRLYAAIASLGDNPRPHGARRLKEYPRAIRARVGDFRIIYAILDRQLLVLVIEVGHRSEVYKHLDRLNLGELI